MNASILVFAAAIAVRAAEAGFSPEQIQQAHAAFAPAICVLSFSSEITKPDGEITQRDGTALGLIVSKDGLVVTHGHMVLDTIQPFNIRATVGQGEDEAEYDAVLLDKPADVNLCFLRIEHEGPLDLPCVEFAADPALELGAPVLVFGLLGETLDYARSFHVRHVSAIIDEPRITYCLDEALPFGFMCGPVIDAAGRAVGVVGYDLSRAEGGELYTRSGHPLIYHGGLFAKYIAEPPLEDSVRGDEDEGWLGIFTQPLTDDLAEYWGLEKEGGAVISTILPESPAAAAGLSVGDVIVELGGTPVHAKQDRDMVGFSKLIREMGPGTEVRIRFIRNGAAQAVGVVLGTQPKTLREAREYVDDVFGLTVREITQDVRIVLNLADDVEGIIVRRVKPGSPAHLAQMRPGVIIMRFGDYPVANVEDFEAAVAALVAERPSEIAVFARIRSTTGFFRIQPRWDEGNDQ
ncbi:MAG TPA: PDZ domain-containing protein [Candidatus Hydrogenedentes bacterium]|nr:PDZ domain-containing protein [Candidatus Hydrogenedentota bacterium]